MSRAFVKESESEWLGDVPPEVSALERFLTKERGVSVYELRTEFNEDEGKEVHVMNDGSCYALDEDKRWYLV